MGIGARRRGRAGRQARAGRAGVGAAGVQAGAGRRRGRGFAGRERIGRTAWARGARSLGMPVRMVGRLAGSIGPVWVLVNLAQF